MTDSSEWNGAGLRRDIRRFFAMTKFDGVAVGIDNEQRFVDRARIGVIGEPLPTKFLFLRLANRGGKIIRGDLEPPKRLLPCAERVSATGDNPEERDRIPDDWRR
jgi:hypothetical protein